ncbi:glycerol-3-phosphate dehydrogenase/oxidase [Pseudonocardia spinosispora]|uniref:glycerol-3-phosphate dehydrogenase/oxidase n=1 Tax=Pseudonocardia spinosispora TaxID=103441 RepID=UPI00040B92FA|nr:glycerol-3-phosphate dehydrogenase/oxidase [Pseudonocardia spinosispora]
MSASRTSRLDPDGRRSALLAASSERYDLAVVGGGVTGVGVALDAAARGLSVVLLDAGDLAGGTSSRSGKTAHGGLRYLEQLNFGLVAGALHERDLMIRTLAPHLVAPEPFLVPLTRRWERAYIGAGVALYDAMALVGRTGGQGGVPHHRHLSRRRALREAPGLAPDSLTGAIQYFDGRMDDARYALAVARTAATYGARLVPHARVTDVHVGGGRVRGVRVRDELSGDELDVRASAVVNAAGVWAADVQAMAGAATFEVTPSKGVHLLVERDAFDSTTGILARADDSVIILRRWYGRWLLGTTDTAYHGDRRSPTVEHDDVEYLLRNVNRYLARPLGRSDVVGAFAGLRPLLRAVRGTPATSAATTSALSRDHAVIEEPAGLVTIVGGKYTTYRVMARDAVDAAARAIGAGLPPTPTARLPLFGAAGWPVVANQLSRLAEQYGVDEVHLRRMLHRYGDELPEVLAPLAVDPTLGTPLPSAAGYLGVEFRHAVTHEGALTLSDVLVRRTRVSIEQPDAGVAAAASVAALVAPILGWDEQRQRREVDAYRSGVTHSALR